MVRTPRSFILGAAALALAALSAGAASGCVRHLRQESCEERLARLTRGQTRIGEQEKPAALAEVERRRQHYDDRLDARERQIRAYYERMKKSIVDPAAERYRALLADARSTDPTAVTKMNPKIAAAKDEFRRAEERAKAVEQGEERASMTKVEAKRKHIQEYFDRERGEVVAKYATVERRLAREIEEEESWLAAKTERAREAAPPPHH